MKPHFSDAERPAFNAYAKMRMDQCWRKGEINDATYLRSLFIMGFLPDVANSELALLKIESRR